MNDPLDDMKARWSHIQSFLFPWLREEVEPMTELLGRLVTVLDVIGLELFVLVPPEELADRARIAAPWPGLLSPKPFSAFPPPAR